MMTMIKVDISRTLGLLNQQWRKRKFGEDSDSDNDDYDMIGPMPCNPTTTTTTTPTPTPASTSPDAASPSPATSPMSEVVDGLIQESTEADLDVLAARSPAPHPSLTNAESILLENLFAYPELGKPAPRHYSRLVKFWDSRKGGLRAEMEYQEIEHLAAFPFPT